jgi:hypothetical protein
MEIWQKIISEVAFYFFKGSKNKKGFSLVQDKSNNLFVFFNNEPEESKRGTKLENPLDKEEIMRFVFKWVFNKNVTVEKR